MLVHFTCLGQLGMHVLRSYSRYTHAHACLNRNPWDIDEFLDPTDWSCLCFPQASCNGYRKSEVTSLCIFPLVFTAWSYSG
mmetsp:Transcript_9885/g.23910  ORF Transcript_9885/g.23910 Transcript_9885/m.23910 type:complete len:81 (-) Transcript_9885:175-417(-)